MNLEVLVSILLGVAITVGAPWGLAAVVRLYLGVSRGKSFVVLGLAIMAGLFTGLVRYQQKGATSPIFEWVHDREFQPLPCLCAGLLAALLVVFVAKLHAKWIAGAATEAEKKSGLEGVRAWLGAGNVICVVLISLLAWLAYDYSPCAAGMLGLLALLAYPGTHLVSEYLQTPPPPESSAPERQRVLNLLDSGKITASECAELLGALNYSDQRGAAQAGQAASAPAQKLALIGALILLVGFFLPWFSINPQAEMNRAAGWFSMDPKLMLGLATGEANFSTPTLRISGGDVQHGLGWLILLLGVAAAALPYFAGHLAEQTRKRMMLAGLGTGAIVLLYLVTQNLRFVSIGIFLAVLGYGLRLAGALRVNSFTGPAAS